MNSRAATETLVKGNFKDKIGYLGELKTSQFPSEIF